MDQFSPARTQRTFEVIGDQIREQVRSGALKSGDKLPAERALAEQFGTSRNAVREALRALEHGGVLTLQKGAHGGAFVTDGDPTAVAQSMQDLLHLGGMSLNDVTEARLVIESAVVEAVITNASDADIDRLEENVNQAEKSTRDGDLDTKASLNISFHTLLAEATGNPVLILMMRLLMDLLRQVHRPITSEDTADVILSRRRLLRHLRKRDAQGAGKEMSDHLKHLHELFARD